jgi:hypothetical protein
MSSTDNPPRTEAEWDAFARAQKGLPPKRVPVPNPPKAPRPPKPTEQERKATHAARMREVRTRDPKQRVSRARLSSVKAPPTEQKSAVVKKMPTKPVGASSPGRAPGPNNPLSAPIEFGDNERAVRAEFPTDRHLVERAQAITLARILDNAEMMPMWPTTSRQLQALCKVLGPPKRKTKANNLVAVARMSGHNARRAQ